jgi:uncharacterized membrane protein
MSDFLLGLGIPPELVVIVVAAVPIFELRGAIPLAMFSLNMPWYSALPLALLGNLLPVPFLLLFLKRVMKWLSRYGLFRRFFDWLCARTMRRSQRLHRNQLIGLILFVGIPLPITGAWTGSLAATLLDFDFKYSFVAIAIGVLLAGIIVTAFCLLGWQAFLLISS